MLESLTFTNLREKPDLRMGRAELLVANWPRYFVDTEELSDRYARDWLRVFPECHELALERGVVVGASSTVPLHWNGEPEDLPGGYSESLQRGIEGHFQAKKPNTLVGLAVTIDPRWRGKRLAGEMLGRMKAQAERLGFTNLLVPVRPTGFEAVAHEWSFEDYTAQVRADGLPEDAWMRLHVKLGAEVLGVCAESMTYSGSRSLWEASTGERYPEDGEYPLAEGLAPLVFAGGHGSYVEPNVWMRYVVVPETKTTEAPKPARASANKSRRSRLRSFVLGKLFK